jgi:hypothetical protein
VSNDDEYNVMRLPTELVRQFINSGMTPDELTEGVGITGMRVIVDDTLPPDTMMVGRYAFPTDPVEARKRIRARLKDMELRLDLMDAAKRRALG